MACDLSCLFVDSTSFTFTWILDNFEYCGQEENQLLESPTFIVETMERSKWRVSIRPRSLYESKVWIALYLRREGDSRGPAIVKVAFEFAFLASDGSVLKSVYTNAVAFSKNSNLGFKNIVERKSLFEQRSKYMPEQALKIRCRMWKSGNSRRPGQCTARTRIGFERQTFLWKINNFSILDVGQEVTFTLESSSDDNKIICLKLFLRKNCSSNVIIKFSDSNQRMVFSAFKSSIVTVLGDFVECGSHEISFPLSEENEECKLSFSKSELMNDKCLYLPNDVLSLYCELAFSTGVIFEGIEDTSYKCTGSVKTAQTLPVNIKVGNFKNTKASDLKMNLGSMFQNKVFCDVVLCVGSETFPAHWFMLSARSPVFQAMFGSEMKEKISNKIHITDLTPDTVLQMLNFMYTDSLEDLNLETAFDLFVASEKYQIMILKDKCSSFLKNNLTFKNACKVLLFADFHQDEELKSTVQDFILENDKSVINSVEWKQFMKTNAQLAAETMFLRYKE